MSISLFAGTLHLSKATPQNGWCTELNAGYEHLFNVRRDNDKLLRDRSNPVNLTLAGGETYTAEAADDADNLTTSIAPL